MVGPGWFTEVSAHYGDHDVSELLWALIPVMILAAVIILPVLGWYLFPDLGASFPAGIDRWFGAWMASGVVMIALAERRGFLGA